MVILGFVKFINVKRCFLFHFIISPKLKRVNPSGVHVREREGREGDSGAEEGRGGGEFLFPFNKFHTIMHILQIEHNLVFTMHTSTNCPLEQKTHFLRHLST